MDFIIFTIVLLIITFIYLNHSSKKQVPTTITKETTVAEQPVQKTLKKEDYYIGKEMKCTCKTCANIWCYGSNEILLGFNINNNEIGKNTIKTGSLFSGLLPTNKYAYFNQCPKCGSANIGKTINYLTYSFPHKEVVRSAHGMQLNFDNGRIFFDKTVSIDIATRLGDYFLLMGVFLKQNKEFKLTKNNGTYQVKMSYEGTDSNNYDFVIMCENAIVELSNNVFNQASVEYHICDNSFNVLKVINIEDKYTFKNPLNNIEEDDFWNYFLELCSGYDNKEGRNAHRRYNKEILEQLSGRFNLTPLETKELYKEVHSKKILQSN